MALHRRFAVLAVSLTACLLIVVAFSAGSVAGVRAPRACSSAQLRLLDVGGQGAASQEYTQLAVHNISGRACTLIGYPSVRLLGAHGQTLRTNEHRCSRLDCFGPLALVAPHLRLARDRVLLNAGGFANVYVFYAVACVPWHPPAETGIYYCPHAASLALVPPGAAHALEIDDHADSAPLDKNIDSGMIAVSPFVKTAVIGP
jgi:hypothetical protein